MTALTQDRNVERIDNPTDRRFGLKAGAVVFQGAIVVLIAGFAKAGVSAVSLTTVGVAKEAATGGAADGDVKVDVERGCFKFKNAAGADAVLAANVSQDCYVLDDQTVTITAANRSKAGQVYRVASDGGVWVEIR